MLSLKPTTKLIAEIALASMFVFFGERLHWTDVPAADMLLTMIWLVGLTNAFNLLDNMDGLCAGTVIIAGAALLVGLAGRPDVVPETRYLAIVLGATSGFLLYNAYPASIFMGDAGSLFLGLTLAALTLTAGGPRHDRSRILSIVVAPVLVLLIPIFDATLVTDFPARCRAAGVARRPRSFVAPPRGHGTLRTARSRGALGACGDRRGDRLRGAPHIRRRMGF